MRWSFDLDSVPEGDELAEIFYFPSGGKISMIIPCIVTMLLFAGCQSCVGDDCGFRGV